MASRRLDVSGRALMYSRAITGFLALTISAVYGASVRRDEGGEYALPEVDSQRLVGEAFVRATTTRSTLAWFLRHCLDGRDRSHLASTRKALHAVGSIALYLAENPPAGLLGGCVCLAQ